jgi:hypothetical protein
MTVDVVHPGPQPALFAFPFAEAERARRAAEDAAEEIAHLVRVHEAAFAPAVEGFEGRTREQFQALLEASLEGCRAHLRALRDQAERVAADIALAEQRLTASEDARTRWHRDHDRWLAAERANA